MSNIFIINRLLLLTMLVGLLALSYQVLSFFIIPVVWAAILGYVTWPLYRRLNRRLQGRRNLSSLIMVLGPVS